MFNKMHFLWCKNRDSKEYYPPGCLTEANLFVQKLLESVRPKTAPESTRVEKWLESLKGVVFVEPEKLEHTVPTDDWEEDWGEDSEEEEEEEDTEGEKKDENLSVVSTTTTLHGDGVQDHDEKDKSSEDIISISSSGVGESPRESKSSGKTKRRAADIESENDAKRRCTSMKI